MTGFAHLQIETLLGLLAIEVKSVNSRYQEISMRLPEELRFLEGEIRAVLAKSVARGKIECRMQWMGEAVLEQTLNTQAMTNLYLLQNEVIKVHPDVKPLTVSQVLSFPGILKPKTVDFELLKKEVLDGLNNALEVFLAARKREGEALAVVINDYCDRIVETVDGLQPKIPEIIDNIQKKLEVRLDEALSKTLVERSTLTKEEVSDRIRQEVILYAIKLDVDEEMKRLLTHVKEVRRLLKVGGEVGKKLDFMVQELNREANTLGSKAATIEMTQTSLVLKTNIEKIREQVQNLE
ncbi:MAG TPA: YicC family protein [Candidatus Aphodousia faecavium]|nr:YicC family protein [Candidatus Aphodousia faecavium]